MVGSWVGAGLRVFVCVCPSYITLEVKNLIDPVLYIWNPLLTTFGLLFSVVWVSDRLVTTDQTPFPHILAEKSGSFPLGQCSILPLWWSFGSITVGLRMFPNFTLWWIKWFGPRCSVCWIKEVSRNQLLVLGSERDWVSRKTHINQKYMHKVKNLSMYSTTFPYFISP